MPHGSVVALPAIELVSGGRVRRTLELQTLAYAVRRGERMCARRGRAVGVIVDSVLLAILRPGELPVRCVVGADVDVRSLLVACLG